MLVGIEIGGSKLQVVAGDEPARIIHRIRRAVTRENGAAGIRAQIESALAELAALGHPTAIGVGFGGPVDSATGRIRRSHHIEGWSEFQLADWLGSVGGSPVSVDNDANVAALGEALYGAGTGRSPVFYVTLGSGVGGGLVVNGDIYHGTGPGEAEIGHLRLDRSGVILESRCSGWAVDARIRSLNRAEPDGLLAKLAGQTQAGEARFLGPAVQRGDPAARRLLGEVAEDLAFGLSHVVHLFHPEVLILGGGLSLVGEPLRAAVEAPLRPFVMEAFAPGPPVRLAALGEDSVPVGALELAARLGSRRELR
jgi:glucokinase